MKIKKIYQGELPENKILNTQSTSQTDTYSCEYINNLGVGGGENLDELPIGTRVEFNGDTIPDGWEQVEEEVVANSITAINENATETTSVYGFVNIPMTIPRNPIIGNKLSIENGGIKIGSGVSYVRVSGFGILNFKNNNSSNAHTYMLTIRKNEEMLSRPMLPIEANQEIKEQLLVIPAMVIEVQEGDIIYLSSYTVSAQVSRSANNNCTLSVEVVENNQSSVVKEISNDEVYSTEEQVIGTYLGKPLYRRTMTKTYTSGTSVQVIEFQPSANVERYTKAFGTIIRPGKSNWMFPGTADVYLYYPNSTMSYTIELAEAKTDIGDVECTMEYTKTTD